VVVLPALSKASVAAPTPVTSFWWSCVRATGVPPSVVVLAQLLWESRAHDRCQPGSALAVATVFGTGLPDSVPRASEEKGREPC
jgi:hypothetical protein